MAGIICCSVLVLFIAQTTFAQEVSTDSINSWIQEKYDAIIESHAPLQQKTAELGEKINQISKGASQEVMHNVSKMNNGMCLKGVQITLAAGGKGIECLTGIAFKAVTKQVDVQMHCFQTMMEYGQRIVDLGKSMIDCYGDVDCVANLAKDATTYEIENHELVSQKLNHVWELEKSLDDARDRCIGEIVDSFVAAKDVCGSTRRKRDINETTEREVYSTTPRQVGQTSQTTVNYETEEISGNSSSVEDGQTTEINYYDEGSQSSGSTEDSSASEESGQTTEESLSSSKSTEEVGSTTASSESEEEIPRPRPPCDKRRHRGPPVHMRRGPPRNRGKGHRREDSSAEDEY